MDNFKKNLDPIPPSCPPKGLLTLPLEEVEIAVVDLETTGLSPAKDAICEVGGVILAHQEIQREFSTLVNPQRRLGREARAVNGLTDEMLCSQPLLGEVLPRLIRFLGDSPFAAHNAGFDLMFLTGPLRGLGLDLYLRPILDTALLARRLLPEFRLYNLESLSRSLGIEATRYHRALEDARTTAHLLAILLERAQQKGIHSLAELEAAFPYRRRPRPPTQLNNIERVVWQAMELGQDLQMNYRNKNGSSSQRRVTPERIDGNFLRAYCHLRQDHRTFRLDRILSCELLALSESFLG